MRAATGDRSRAGCAHPPPDGILLARPFRPRIILSRPTQGGTHPGRRFACPGLVWNAPLALRSAAGRRKGRQAVGQFAGSVAFSFAVRLPSAATGRGLGNSPDHSLSHWRPPPHVGGYVARPVTSSRLHESRLHRPSASFRRRLRGTAWAILQIIRFLIVVRLRTSAATSRGQSRFTNHVFTNHGSRAAVSGRPG